MMNLWTADISWRWPAAGALAVLAAVGLFWLIGLQAPVPRFRVAPFSSDHIIPVDWPWWRQVADQLHGRKYMMLTFDDGPADHATNVRILHTLEAHHAHAVFFTVCRHAQLPGRAQDLLADVTAGDLIGDHSYTHPKLPKLPENELRHQIGDCQKLLERITAKPVHWFRPPFGQQSPKVLAELKRDGLQDVLWDANSGDSWLRRPDKIERLTLKEASDGSIMLMHSRPTTAAVLDRTLTGLERKGYRFVLARPN